MKKINLYIAGAAVALFATACTHEDIFDVAGEGKLVLTTSVNTDMKFVSRAVEDSLQQNCMIWISNDKGLVRRYNKLTDMPGQIDLVAGHYVAEGWTGDSVPASWDKRWFKGIQDFDINPGQTSEVKLECKIANVGATVHYAEGIEQVLNDFSIVFGHSVDTLVFMGREERRGYFMMPSFDKDLKYTLRGTQIDGSEFVYDGTIYNAKTGYEYALNVNYTQSSTEVGGAIFSIIVDENEITMEHDILLIPAPKFTGYGFDINAPIMGEAGTFDDLTVYVSSATTITGLEMCSELLRTWVPILGGDAFSWFEMNDTGKDALADAGISIKSKETEDPSQTLIQITFAENLMNTLTDGKYEINLTATDIAGKSSNATMLIIVSDAPVVTKPLSESAVEYFSATLSGTVQKENTTNFGFNYRVKPSGRANEDWTFVAGQYVGAGPDYTAQITELTPNTTYQYVAVSDDFESSEVLEFTTRKTAQLPNSGFEDWYYYNNKIWVPGQDYGSNYFWDSGNHGGATVSKNFTTRNSTYKHSGEYSACLKSEKVVIQFAAGNLFAGKYLKTDGTNGVLGWGRPFTEKPKSVNVWVKYVPVNVTDGGSHIKKGDPDQGIIYMALVDNSMQTYNGERWPCVVKTKSSERQLFDKDGDNVIAYGEHVFTSATEGDDLILINIPIDYLKEGVYPSNIIFVASASRYGDYFEGGSGSTMYIDDIELIY